MQGVSPPIISPAQRDHTDSKRLAGTNPIHNKKPKKKPAGEEDEEDKAFKAKQAAGTIYLSNGCQVQDGI